MRPDFIIKLNLLFKNILTVLHIPLLAAGLLIFTEVSVFAQSSSENSSSYADKQLSLDVFIKTACEANPEFKKIIIDRLYLEYKDDLNLDIGELTAEFETGYMYSADTDKDGITGTATVKKLFAETATDISLTYDTSPGTIDRSSSVNFRISQEIAENSFGKKLKLEKKSLDYEKELILYRMAEAYEDYLYYLITLYYNWMSSWRELEAAEKSLIESRKLYENIILRKKSNIADQDDVNRSELQILTKMEAVASAENKYQKNSAAVSDAAGLPPDSGFIPENTESGFSYFNIEDILSSDISFESRTYKILDLGESIGVKNIEIAKNELLPQISLFTEYNISGTEYNLEEDRARVLSFGISLNQIGKRRKETAALKTAEIDLEKKALENRITRKDLDIALSQYSKDIKSSRELAEIYKRKTVLSELIVEEQRKQYRIGKTDLSSLIDSINTLDQNRRKKLDYESELNILSAGWLNITDSLIVENEDSIFKPSF